VYLSPARKLGGVLLLVTVSSAGGQIREYQELLEFGPSKDADTLTHTPVLTNSWLLFDESLTVVDSARYALNPITGVITFKEYPDAETRYHITYENIRFCKEGKN